MIYLYILTGFFVFTFLKSFIRLLIASNYIKNNKKNINTNNTSNKKISILMPVYKEKNNIKKSIEYFKNFKDILDIYYITTSKETDNETMFEVQKQIEEQNTENVYLINCPNTVGTMATQITYAAKQLKDDDIIGLYNIDSFPESETFKFVLNNIKTNLCFQQVSYFDDKLHGVLKSAQNWQNRWSIIYELGKMQSPNFLNFRYAIGHGFFIIKKDLEKIGYWSDEILNEDNELGYRLMCNGFKIKPVPFLEKADFARSKKIYIKQQSVWFNGPLYSFKYYANNKKKKFKNNLLYAILNFKAAASWLLLPWIYYINIVVAIFINPLFSLIYLALLILYLSILNFGVKMVLFKNKYISSLRPNNIPILSDIIFFTMHTLGPFYTIYKILTKKNTIKNKYKTEK